MDAATLTSLHNAAAASDAQSDWMAFYQTLAGTALVIPLSEAATETARPALADHQGVAAVEAYADMLDYAGALKSAGNYAEISGADLAAMLRGQAVPVLLRAGADPILITPEQLDWIAQTFGAEVVRAEGAGVEVTTPELPALALMEALGKTVGALGADCPEAWLVTLAEPGEPGELVLVLGLSGEAERMQDQIAETVTRAVQAATDQRFAVACPGRGSRLMDIARRTGVGIGSGEA